MADYTESASLGVGLALTANRTCAYQREATGVSAWVSPTGHNDPDSAWVNAEDAYDGNTTSNTLQDGAGHYLELTTSAVTCDKVRIYGAAPDGSPSLVVDVYYASAWHNIHTGSIDESTWVELPIGSTEIVTAARVKETVLDRFFIAEFEFRSVGYSLSVGVALSADRDVAYQRTSGLGVGAALAATRSVVLERTSALGVGLALSATRTLALLRTSALGVGVAITAQYAHVLRNLIADIKGTVKRLYTTKGDEW